MTQSKKTTIFVMCVCVSIALTGCDQINSLLGKETKTESQPVESASVSTTSTSEKKVDDKPKDRPLQANEMAKVGDWILTKAEFDQRMQNAAQTIPNFDPEDLEAQALILDGLIRQQLMTQEAERLGYSKNKDIRQAVDDFRQTLLVQQLSQDITEDIIVTPEDARDFYNENPEEFILPVEYRVREIVTYTEQGAKEILVQILQGADFATLAQQQSKAETAANGGDLGYITQAGVPKVQNVIESLNVGGVSSVFEGPKGYYIIKLEDKRGGEPQPFSEIEDRLVNALTIERRQQAILDRLAEIAQDTTIEINQDYFGPPEGSVPEE